MQTNVFHTITRLIILIPLQCHGDSEKERERQWEREIFRNREGDKKREAGEERERERAHQAKRSAVAVYFPMSS